MMGSNPGHAVVFFMFVFPSSSSLLSLLWLYSVGGVSYVVPL